MRDATVHQMLELGLARGDVGVCCPKTLLPISDGGWRIQSYWFQIGDPPGPSVVMTGVTNEAFFAEWNRINPWVRFYVTDPRAPYAVIAQSGNGPEALHCNAGYFMANFLWQKH